MKIFAVSDMHGKLDGLNPSNFDICIIAGDFAQLKGRGKWHIYDQKKWVEKQFIPWIKSYSGVRFVIVPGNHDFFADPRTKLIFQDLNFNIVWPDNAHFLLNSGCNINGLTFWGSPNVPIISYSWAFETEHDKLREEFGRIPGGLDVLITHSPPAIPDKFIDYSLQTNNGPFGSPELTDILLEKKPRFLFCGHIHSGSHNTVEFGSTKCYNVSRVDENYEIAYEPTCLEI